MSQINALPINGITIADLALLAPGPGQFLEVGGATEGRIDIDALAAYARVGTATASQGTLAEAALQPSDAGATGLALLATETQSEARTAIGSPAFAGDAATATITTNSVVRSQIDSSGNVLSTSPGGSTLLPEFKCRAWVNFDGATTPPTIRASGNVSSITRFGTGLYTINFTAAMPDGNYAVSCQAVIDVSYPSFCGSYYSTRTTTSVDIGASYDRISWGPNPQSVDVFIIR